MDLILRFSGSGYSSQGGASNGTLRGLSFLLDIKLSTHLRLSYIRLSRVVVIICACWFVFIWIV